MPRVPGYRISERLHAGAHAVLYRAQRESDEQPVILKVLKSRFPPVDQITYLRREYEVLRRLMLHADVEPASSGIVQVDALETFDHSAMIVERDIGGDSLARLDLAGKLDVLSCLRIALRLAGALARIHQQRILHLHLNPGHVINNALSGEVILIDFGGAAEFSIALGAQRSPAEATQPSAYMAPEQRVLTSDGADTRTDLYALGAVIYELAVGQVWGAGNWPGATPARPQATLPVPPHQVEQRIPPAFANVILKLLAAVPDERYQSAAGLKADLETCLEQWTSTGAIALPALGTRDLSDRFEVSPRRSEHVVEVRRVPLLVERVAVTSVDDPPLEPAGVAQMLADALHSTPDTTTRLADLVYPGTGGNPSLVRRYVWSLYTRGHIAFDYQHGQWQWDLAAIQETDVPDDLGVFLARRLPQLPAQTLDTAQVAAHIGHQFDLATVALVTDRPLADVEAALVPAVSAGLIVRIDELTSAPRLGPASDERVRYHFAHERVRQAFLRLVPEPQRPLLHRAIGGALLRQTDHAHPGRVVLAVNHLDLGRSLVANQDERVELARLNLLAAGQARDAEAYQEERRFLAIGRELLPPESWETHYELMRDLNWQAAEAAYRATDFSEAEALALDALGRVTGLPDRVKLHQVRVLCALAENRLVEAIDVALAAIGLVGLRLAEHPPDLARMTSLSQLQTMADTTMLALMQLLASALGPIVCALPTALLRMLSTMLDVSLQHGAAPATAYACMWCGVYLCANTPEIARGYELGIEAQRMAGRPDGQPMEPRVRLTFAGWVRHFGESIRGGAQALREVYRQCAAIGDLSGAATAAQRYCTHLLCSGEPLDRLYETQITYLRETEPLHQEAQGYVHRLWAQVVRNFRGLSANPRLLRGEFCDAAQLLHDVHVQANARLTYMIHCANTMLSCFFRDHAAAVKSAEEAERYWHPGRAPEDVHHAFYSSLSLLGSYREGDPRRQHLWRVEVNQLLLRRWAEHAPMNFRHLVDLIEAERARIDQDDRRAVEQYRRAIRGARQNGFIHHQALACELAGEYYRARGPAQMARAMVLAAYGCYRLWRATAKLRDLEERYPEWLFAASGRSTDGRPGREGVATSNHSAGEVRMFQRLEAEVKARTSELRAEKEHAEAARRDAEAARREAERRQQMAERRRRTVEGLRDVLTILNSDRSLNEVLDYVAQEACRLLGCEAALIYVVPASPTGVHVQSSFGISHRDVVPSYLRIDPATLRSMLLSHGAIAIADVKAFLASPPESAGNSDEAPDFVIPLAMSFQSVLAAPVLVDGELSAGLAVYHSAAHPFNEDDLELASLLSDQAALAIDNDRLREQVKQASAEAERVRLARDLHDSVSQSLFSANLIADALPGVWEADPAAGRRGVQDLRQTMRAALAEMGAMLVELHPAALTSKPLGELLQQLGEAMSGRMHIPVTVEVRGGDSPLPEPVQVALYRLAQEALSNIAKHASAQHAWIQLRREKGQIVLRVRDDGVGFATRQQTSAQHMTSKGSHLGLAVMRERVDSIGASLSVRSKPGQGTTVVVRWPAHRG